MKDTTNLVKSVAGSRLYGTSRPDSDTDIRGVCLEPIECILGLGTFEQYIELEPQDITIYGLKKFCNLALQNNPNILDLLFTPKEYWIEHNPLWYGIYDIRHSFLSTRVIDRYLGYAKSQLHKLTKTRLESSSIYGYDVKHGAHLARLLLQLETILEQGDFNPVLTGVELDIVKNVLNGNTSLDHLSTIFNDADIRLRGITTYLPVKPNYYLVENTVIDMYREYLKGK